MPARGGSRARRSANGARFVNSDLAQGRVGVDQCRRDHGVSTCSLARPRCDGPPELAPFPNRQSRTTSRSSYRPHREWQPEKDLAERGWPPRLGASRRHPVTERVKKLAAQGLRGSHPALRHRARGVGGGVKKNRTPRRGAPPPGAPPGGIELTQEWHGPSPCAWCVATVPHRETWLRAAQSGYSWVDEVHERSGGARALHERTAFCSDAIDEQLGHPRREPPRRPGFRAPTARSIARMPVAPARRRRPGGTVCAQSAIATSPHLLRHLDAGGHSTSIRRSPADRRG
jgi:hypothetical protein